MEKMDRIKDQTVRLATLEGSAVSEDQVEIWRKYRKLMNSFNIKNGQEEIQYKRTKVKYCKDNAGMVWSLAKNYMNWKSQGPPVQLEVEINKKVTLVPKLKILQK